MVNVSVLKRELKAKAQEGLALIKSTAETCDAEGNRAQTPEETAALKGIEQACLDLEGRIVSAEGDAHLLAELTRLSAGTAPLAPRAGRRLSLGEQFVSAPEYEFFRKGGHRSSSVWRSPAVELTPEFGQMAATLTEDPASGGALVQPQYLPGILQIPQRRMVVADLLAQGATDSNLISYMTETAFTNAAAAVAEGALKPESTLTFAPVTDPVRKLAHWLPVTEEMLEDAPQIRSYIDARLRLGIQLEEEEQLLIGDGTAPNISGILDRAGLTVALPQGTDTNADALLKQTMLIFAASFLMPDAYVLHPSNWTTTILTKTTGSGEYLGGGPFSPIQGAQLWGLPVVITPMMTATIGLVGAFKQAAQVFRKGGIRVEASNSHSDFFIKNLVAIRAEERLALAVYRPAAFGTVTGLD